MITSLIERRDRTAAGPLPFQLCPIASGKVLYVCIGSSNPSAIGSLVAAADEIRELAIKHRQLSAAVSAVREIGLLTGLRIDRREVGSPGELERLSDAELQDWIASETAMLIELPDDEPDEAP